VADWRPVKAAPKKLKLKGAGEAPAIQLTENPDILRTLSQKRKGRPRLVIGFAAETHDVEALATEKRARKGCDWIVANDVSGDVMGGNENEVYLITPKGIERWPRLAKDDVSRRLAGRVVDALTGPAPRLSLAAE